MLLHEEAGVVFPTLTIGQLVLTVTSHERMPAGDSLETVEVALEVENRASGLGDARLPPLVELHDAQGGVFGLASDEGWTEMQQAAESTSAVLRFAVPVDAAALELVFAPGTPEETSVPLVVA